MDTDYQTYRASTGGIGKTGSSLRSFGERQNDLNETLLRRMAALERQNKELSARLEKANMALARVDAQIESLEEKLAAANARADALEKEQALNIKRFGRVAADLDTLEKDTARLKLTAKLNTNAIDRLAKKDRT